MSSTTRKDATPTEPQMKLAIAQTLSQPFAYNAPVVMLDFSVNDQGEFEGKFKDATRPRIFSFNIKGQSVTFKPYTPGRMDSVDDWEEFSSGYSYRVDAGIGGNKKPQCVKPTAYNCGAACINIRKSCNSKTDDPTIKDGLKKLEGIGKDYAKTTPKTKETPKSKTEKPVAEKTKTLSIAQVEGLAKKAGVPVYKLEQTAKQAGVSGAQLEKIKDSVAIYMKTKGIAFGSQIKTTRSEEEGLTGDGSHEGMPRNAQEYYNLATKNGKQITLKEAQDTVEAINDWTGGGYEEIRKDQKEGRVNERATLIDNYIKNLTPYKGEVYRGITFDNKKEMEDWLKGDKDGVLDNQNAHASWSSELEVAKGFATDIEEDDLDRVPVVIKSVNNKSGVSIFNLSWLGKIESEVIVPKNAKHKVKSVREEGGVMYVDVEEVDPLQEKVSINQKKVSKSSKTTTAKPGIEAEEPEKNTNPAKTKLQPSVMSKADQAKIGGEWAKTAIDFVNLVKKAEQLPPGSFPKQEYVLGKKDIVTESFIVTTALKIYGEGEDVDKSEEVDVVSLNDKSGKPQGFFCIRKEASKKDSMYIEFLGSNPSNVINEKKGVGKEIMYHAIQESRKRGLKGKIKLQALEGAVPFYKTIGFKETIDKEGDSYFDLSEESANAFIKEYEKKLK